MNPAEIASRREALEREIAQREALLDAYKLVERDLKGVVVEATTTPPDQVTKPVSAPRKDASGYGTTSDKVRDVIATLRGSFTASDIFNALNGSLDQNTISYTLSRFARSGEIKITSRGKGRKVNVFEASKASS